MKTILIMIAIISTFILIYFAENKIEQKQESDYSVLMKLYKQK
jgi:phage protein D